MKNKRHLIYRCEITGGQKYTKREVSSGCGCWTVHSTTRMTTPSYKEDQIRPWIATCKYCGKKSRMRTRDEPNHEFATRDAAVVEAARRNDMEGNNRGPPQFLVYECKNRARGKPLETLHVPKSGCGRIGILRTRTIMGRWDDPWVAQCPECKKRNWLNDADDVTVHSTKAEALAEKELREKDKDVVTKDDSTPKIEKDKDVSKDVCTPKIMPMSDYLALTHDSIVINLRKDDPKTPLIMSIIQSVLHLGEWEE